jgi:hypothetical protein
MIFGAQFGAVITGTPVRNTPFLRAVLYLKNYPFTKTGSGQT